MKMALAQRQNSMNRNAARPGTEVSAASLFSPSTPVRLRRQAGRHHTVEIR
jgi:hypothetical protein